MNSGRAPARRAVVNERDGFMASTVAGAATGRAALAPALAADTAADGGALWRYVMGRDAPDGAPPPESPLGGRWGRGI